MLPLQDFDNALCVSSQFTLWNQPGAVVAVAHADHHRDDDMCDDDM